MSQQIDLIDPNQSLPELREAVATLLSVAEKNGATDAVAAVTLDAGMSVTARQGDVETVEMQSDRGVSITVFKETAEGTHKGSASTNDLTANSLEKTVMAAVQLADFTQADTAAGLAEAEQMATEFPDLDLYHPWALTTDRAVELAIDCEAAAFKQDKRITNSDGATVSTGVELTVLANSRGFSADILGSGHSASCSVLAEQNGQMQRDYAWTSARCADDLLTVSDVGQTAAERALEKLDARSVATGQFPVLFDRRVARGLFSGLLGALSGGAQYRRNSFLLDAVGQTVLPDWINVWEQPLLARGARSSSFDSDAVATREQSFIERGVVSQYLLGVYSARKLGLSTTGNGGGARNVSVSHNAESQADVLADMGTGLWVTELMGQGVNPVTGDYSRGASGFWVEQGKVVHPVDGITIAGNLKEMYQHIRAISADSEPNVNIQCGAVLVDGMTIAGE